MALDPMQAAFAQMLGYTQADMETMLAASARCEEAFAKTPLGGISMEHYPAGRFRGMAEDDLGEEPTLNPAAAIEEARQAFLRSFREVIAAGNHDIKNVSGRKGQYRMEFRAMEGMSTGEDAAIIVRNALAAQGIDAKLSGRQVSFTITDDAQLHAIEDFRRTMMDKQMAHANLQGGGRA